MTWEECVPGERILWFKDNVRGTVQAVKKEVHILGPENLVLCLYVVWDSEPDKAHRYHYVADFELIRTGLDLMLEIL